MRGLDGGADGRGQRGGTDDGDRPGGDVRADRAGNGPRPAVAPGGSGRGRTRPGRYRPGRRGLPSAKAAGITATAGLVAVGLSLAACSTGGTGSRDEGAARTGEVAAAAPTPPPSATAGAETAVRVDPIALLKDDPKIGKRLKADLKPCVADAYPVDTSYGNLTNSAAPDVVVNVMTCGDAVGIGTYVYRKQSDRYENVFTAEDAAVYGTIDRGELVVTKQVYAKGDPVAYPSGEDVITYRWAGNRFTQHDWVHNDYSRAVGDSGVEEPAPAVSPPT
ncbi:hypothetical protein ACIQCR_00120 [Streptomyces sp. NPDC093249]|uniref:hypothetical protein n=1 Tax=unclassified Streptomyces TaxID=2593676 RepID=UPI0037F1C8D6